jgi:hypothetical protein
MKRFLETLLFSVIFAFSTSCGTHYYDTIATEVATMTIPGEGGLFEFKVVDYEMDYTTRFQPAEWFKGYCYRVVEDGVVREESDIMYDAKYVWVEFAPNNTNHTKEYAIDVKVADDYYKAEETPSWGEWQTVWKITQPSVASE